MRFSLLVGLATALALSAAGADARDRYAQRPPVLVSPDLSAPWVMQLKRKPARHSWQARAVRMPAQPYPRVQRRWPDQLRTAAIPRQPQMYTREEMQRRLDPKFLP